MKDKCMESGEDYENETNQYIVPEEGSGHYSINTDILDIPEVNKKKISLLEQKDRYGLPVFPEPTSMNNVLNSLNKAHKLLMEHCPTEYEIQLPESLEELAYRLNRRNTYLDE